MLGPAARSHPLKRIYLISYYIRRPASFQVCFSLFRKVRRRFMKQFDFAPKHFQNAIAHSVSVVLMAGGCTNARTAAMFGGMIDPAPL
jgi:hypothetical protein